jgi:poly-gamma-glutamate capsule biosynthesis protein CapA/YwtB (metallophosphatase superfamily)
LSGVTLRCAFVGDLALGDHPKAIGLGFYSRYARGLATGAADRLRPPGPPPDLFFANLEFTLGMESADQSNLSQMECRGATAFVRFLVDAGVNAVNVATNHSSQHGVSVFRETVGALRASGIHVVGTPADFTEAGIMRVGATRVALLGWSDRPRQYAPDDPPYNEFGDDAVGRVDAARQRSDVVIVSLHWGNEFILVPSDRERAIAHELIDAGAHFVIGHHPHVLREVEQYHGGTIAYSLGNCVCDMTWDERTRVTGWLTATVDRNRVTEWSLLPAVIDDDYLPRPAVNHLRSVWDRVAAARRTHAERVARAGYASVANAERRRHAFRTGLMMLRNAHRYPKGIARKLFGGALGNRLRRSTQRVLPNDAARGQDPPAPRY